MINFDKGQAIYWSESEKISYLQRRILVYSIMYYKYNESCISDFDYDSISKQLAKMQKKASKDVLKKTTYYYVMKDFVGSTGFDLPSKLSLEDYEYLHNIAFNVLKSYKRRKGN